eukprot:2403827-Amphidinium_carterae.1
MRRFYSVLGILRSSDDGEIRCAYRRRALATHPDKGGIIDACWKSCILGRNTHWEELLTASSTDGLDTCPSHLTPGDLRKVAGRQCIVRV